MPYLQYSSAVGQPGISSEKLHTPPVRRLYAFGVRASETPAGGTTLILRSTFAMRVGPTVSGQANGEFPHGTACCLVLLHRLGVEAPQPIARGLDTSRAAWREEDFSVRAYMRNRTGLSRGSAWLRADVLWR
jgi:hypothetical protein